MIRDTSIQAYHQIKREGLLSERRWRVYDIVYRNGPLIGAKVAEIYKRQYGRTSASETIRNRLTELRNTGVVSEVGRALDPHTGMNVILWDVTSRLPQKLEKKNKIKCLWCNGTGYQHLDGDF